MGKRQKMPHGGEVQVWQKGESGNPKGRPKLTLGSILDELNASGIETPSRAEIEHAYISLTVMSIEQLQKVMQNEDLPVLLRICAGKIASNEGFEIIEKMLDRALGPKPKEPILVSQQIESQAIKINIIGINPTPSNGTSPQTPSK